MTDRDFKGVWIPKDVWLDDRLSMLDKGILTEIDSLDNGTDGCFASNEHLAEFCQCSAWKVSTSISRLAELGYIRIDSFDGRKRKIKSSLVKIQSLPCENPKSAFGKSQDSNTSNNTTTNTPIIHMASRTENDLLSGFVEFWKVYPNKVKKSNAIAAWKSGKCEQIADRIIADVKERCSTEWKGDGAQYVPHPTTYLHQRRWEDETRPTERKEKTKGDWHNPALDYAQRDYSGTQPKSERVYMTFDDEE